MATRRDFVDHIFGVVTEHAFGTHVEYLDDAVFVGRDAGEVGAVENRVLQRAGFEQDFLTARFDDFFSTRLRIGKRAVCWRG